MKVIAFIEDDALIKKILKHLGLWDTRIHDPPRLDDVHIPSVELLAKNAKITIFLPKMACLFKIARYTYLSS